MSNPLFDARPGMRRVFLTNMVLPARIGVYAHEQHGTQRIRLNIDLAVEEGEIGDDEIARVVDYQRVANAAREVVAAGHVKLVETLAERIAAACMVDKRIKYILVRVEKLDIFSDADGAGVEIVRERPHDLSTSRS